MVGSFWSLNSGKNWFSPRFYWCFPSRIYNYGLVLPFYLNPNHVTTKWLGRCRGWTGPQKQEASMDTYNEKKIEVAIHDNKTWGNKIRGGAIARSTVIRPNRWHPGRESSTKASENEPAMMTHGGTRRRQQAAWLERIWLRSSKRRAAAGAWVVVEMTRSSGPSRRPRPHCRETVEGVLAAPPSPPLPAFLRIAYSVQTL
jgi:hypothetical protein